MSLIFFIFLNNLSNSLAFLKVSNRRKLNLWHEKTSSSHSNLSSRSSWSSQVIKQSSQTLTVHAAPIYSAHCKIKKSHVGEQPAQGNNPLGEWEITDWSYLLFLSERERGSLCSRRRKINVPMIKFVFRHLSFNTWWGGLVKTFKYFLFDTQQHIMLQQMTVQPCFAMTFLTAHAWIMVFTCCRYGDDSKLSALTQNQRLPPLRLQQLWQQERWVWQVHRVFHGEHLPP